MIQIQIDTGNAAFEYDEGSEVARILRQLADRIAENGPVSSRDLYDLNGNRVGELEVGR